MPIINVRIPDFLLAGRASTLSEWADHATRIGILWCYEHQCRGGTVCSSCIHKGFCCISSALCSLKVIPIQHAPNFDHSTYETVLLITPRKHQSINLVDVKILVTAFVSTFSDCDVKTWESYVRPDGQLSWERFGELRADNM